MERYRTQARQGSIAKHSGALLGDFPSVFEKRREPQQGLPRGPLHHAKGASFPFVYLHFLLSANPLGTSFQSCARTQQSIYYRYHSLLYGIITVQIVY
jgi:hypothetical protein